MLLLFVYFLEFWMDGWMDNWRGKWTWVDGNSLQADYDDDVDDDDDDRDVYTSLSPYQLDLSLFYLHMLHPCSIQRIYLPHKGMA